MKKNLVVCLLLMSACGQQSAIRENKDGMIILAHKAVEQKLRDPSSAEYRNEKLGSYQGVSVICGEVNAKNGFGGMTGFERYVSNGGDATVLASQMDASEFSNVWSQMGC